MKLAVSAYRPEWHPDWASLVDKLDAMVAEAVEAGAELLLFPEYGGCEAALIGTPQDKRPADWAKAMAKAAPVWLSLHQALARKYKVHILAGSLCVQEGEALVNRAYFVAPSGDAVSQDKMILIPYEREVMGLTPGKQISAFDTALGRLGILICYDSEFPLQARALCEVGVDAILVPSATDLPAGQTRVRQSCRARAIENQVLVVQSPVLGPVPMCDILDQGTGIAAVFCPPDHGLPSDGIIAQGDLDQHGWTYAQVDTAAISAPRKTGQVGNFGHWTEQDDRLSAIAISTLA